MGECCGSIDPSFDSQCGQTKWPREIDPAELLRHICRNVNGRDEDDQVPHNIPNGERFVEIGKHKKGDKTKPWHCVGRMLQQRRGMDQFHVTPTVWQTWQTMLIHCDSLLFALAVRIPVLRRRHWGFRAPFPLCWLRHVLGMLTQTYCFCTLEPM